MSSQAVISTMGLTKVFRDFWRRARVRAVNGLDLNVEQGQIYGLLGPNGSGKSTTIKMLLGLMHPTRGRVTVFGRPPSDVQVKSRIGYLPEESYLYRFLNARETLNFYGQLFQIHRKERLRRIEELLEMVGLKSAARRPVGEYSKGMQRRIGLAQALINDPELLILDEPTSGLDPVGSKLVKDIIVRIGQVHKKTILLSSHLLADVEEVCDYVTILYGGQTQVTGTMREVLEREDQTQINCGALSPATVAAIQQLVEEREGKAISVTTPKDRLEELFLRIVQDAHRERVETSGSAQAGAIAGFLGGDRADGAQYLESLTQDKREESPAPPPVAKKQSKSKVLETLTKDAPPPTSPPATTKTDPRVQPRKEVDRSILADLTGDDDDGDAT
ncbi:MAG: ABC transporter ATP-binding protein [Phycisphaerae bacterium]